MRGNCIYRKVWKEIFTREVQNWGGEKRYQGCRGDQGGSKGGTQLHISRV